MNTTHAVLALAFVAAAPILGGVLMGLDRKLTARMQSRAGPPLMQPFYDFIKLWSKKPVIGDKFQPMLAAGYLIFTLLGLGLLAFGEDLMHILFTITLADLCLIVAAFNTKSPYSNLGARRELLSLFSYEPIMVVTAFSVQMITKSFLVESIFELTTPLFLVIPAAYVVHLIVLVIDMKKSPFDVSASAHAHQELVRGVYTEFSGYVMAIVELAHWTKIIFILSLVSLFWAPNLLIGALLALALWFAAIVIDNCYPRLNWKSMLRTSWLIGILLILVNMVGLIILRVI